MAKDTDEIGALLRELIKSGHETPDRRLGEIFVNLTRKGREVIDTDGGEEGQ